MPRVNLLLILTTCCKADRVAGRCCVASGDVDVHQREMTRSRSSVHQSQSSGDRDKTGCFALGRLVHEFVK